MKKLFLSLVFVASICSSFAQAPNVFKYQTVVRNASGNIIANQTVHFRINIHRDTPTGLIIYAETHLLATNSYGLANMEIGNGLVVTGNFSNIDWGNHNYHIRTELDPNGGNSFTTMGTTQFLSVPYALNAKTVSGLATGDLTDVSSTTPNTNEVLKWNGSQWAPAVDVSGSGGASPWTLSSNNVYRLNGRLGFGTSSPSYFVDVVQTLSGANNAGINASINGGSGSGTNSGIRSALTGSTASFSIGVEGSASGTTTLTNGSIVGGEFTAITTSAPSVFGVRATSEGGANVRNYGIYAECNDNSATFNIGAIGFALETGSENNYGVYGFAENDGTGASYSVFGTSSVDTDYAGYFDGDVLYTGTLSSTSDRRLKENIKDFSNALNLVNSLKVYSYNFVAEEEYSDMHLAKGKQFGFIAQELEKVIPELVIENKVPNTSGVREGDPIRTTDASFKSVNYIGVIPILTKAIQEQQELIGSLEQRILELEEKISKL